MKSPACSISLHPLDVGCDLRLTQDLVVLPDVEGEVELILADGRVRSSQRWELLRELRRRGYRAAYLCPRCGAEYDGGTCLSGPCAPRPMTDDGADPETL